MATHNIYLSYGGSSVFLFSSGSNKLMSYVPQSPDLTTIDSNSILGDGGERPLTTRRNVTETLAFEMSASTKDLLQTAKQYLQSIILRAERHQKTGSGSPVYVCMQPYGTTASAYRSELLSGKIDMDENSLGWRWNRGVIDVVFAFTRRHYWEGDEATVILANQSGTGSRITIRNENLSGSNNYVEIAASAVLGEVPTPAKIVLRNDSASSMDTRKFYFWHNVVNSPQSFTHFWQAESASMGTSGSIVSNAVYSGASAIAVPVSSSISSTNTIAKFALSGSFLDACAGGNFLVIGKMGNDISANASVYAKVSARFPQSTGLTTIGEGLETRLSSTTNFQTFGTIRLPPAGRGSGAYADLALWLTVRSSASFNFYLDYIQIVPVDTGYAYIDQLGYSWASGLAVFDYIENEHYLSSSTYTTKAPIMVAGGVPIMLYPSEVQRLYFSVSDANAFYVHRNLNIEMKYRPRRLSI